MTQVGTGLIYYAPARAERACETCGQDIAPLVLGRNKLGPHKCSFNKILTQGVIIVMVQLFMLLATTMHCLEVPFAETRIYGH